MIDARRCCPELLDNTGGVLVGFFLRREQRARAERPATRSVGVVDFPLSAILSKPDNDESSRFHVIAPSDEPVDAEREATPLRLARRSTAASSSSRSSPSRRSPTSRP